MIKDCSGCGEPLFGSMGVCPKCGRPTDVDSVRIGGVPAPEQLRDPALAFLISLILPGAGQFYSGARKRGIATLGFLVGFLLLALRLGLTSALGASGARAALLLYAFSFLDAYLTALDVNRGLEATLAENPRVAAVLNLIAPGFGYFYLMQRTKGMIFFFAFKAPGLLLAQGRLGVVVGLVAELASVVIAVDAYRLANRARAYVLERAAESPTASWLPVFVPVGCAALLAAGYAALLLLGVLLLLLKA
jgi:TM2 domain-containing membrane protein YozV